MDTIQSVSDADFDSFWEDESKNKNRNRIRVGRQYQAKVPSLLKPGQPDGRNLSDLETLRWKPGSVNDEQLEHYLSVAKAVGHFSRAFYHEENQSEKCLQSALRGLSEFVSSHHPRHRDAGCQVAREWTPSETQLFAQALGACGKNFGAIKKDFLPWKSANSLIDYYYSKDSSPGSPKKEITKDLEDKEANLVVAKKEDSEGESSYNKVTIKEEENCCLENEKCALSGESNKSIKGEPNLVIKEETPVKEEDKDLQIKDEVDCSNLKEEGESSQDSSSKEDNNYNNCPLLKTENQDPLKSDEGEKSSCSSLAEDQPRPLIVKEETSCSSSKEENQPEDLEDKTTPDLKEGTPEGIAFVQERNGLSSTMEENMVSATLGTLQFYFEGQVVLELAARESNKDSSRCIWVQTPRTLGHSRKKMSQEHASVFPPVEDPEDGSGETTTTSATPPQQDDESADYSPASKKPKLMSSKAPCWSPWATSKDDSSLPSTVVHHYSMDHNGTLKCDHCTDSPSTSPHCKQNSKGASGKSAAGNSGDRLRMLLKQSGILSRILSSPLLSTSSHCCPSSSPSLTDKVEDSPLDLSSCKDAKADYSHEGNSSGSQIRAANGNEGSDRWSPAQSWQLSYSAPYYPCSPTNSNDGPLDLSSASTEIPEKMVE